jgi:hypothetical protein
METSGTTINGTITGITINGDFDINTTDKSVIIENGVASEDHTTTITSGTTEN